jgi:hypothetical protein
MPGTPSPGVGAWAVPPSPARDIRFVFRAFADPGPGRAGIGLKGGKVHPKNCANLCSILQFQKPHQFNY